MNKEDRTKAGMEIIKKVIKFKDRLLEKKLVRKHQLEADMNVVANIAAMSIIRFSENYGYTPEELQITFVHQVAAIISANKTMGFKC